MFLRANLDTDPGMELKNDEKVAKMDTTIHASGKVGSFISVRSV